MNKVILGDEERKMFKKKKSENCSSLLFTAVTKINVCKCNLSHKSLGHKPEQCQCVVTILLN